MQSVSGKPLYESALHENIRDLIFSTREKYGTSDAFIFRRDPTEAEIHKTYNDFVGDVEALGTALLARGWGDAHMSVIGENAYEWVVAYCAILSSDAVGVPLDRLLPEEEVQNLLLRGKVRVLFYHHKLHDMVRSISEKKDADFPTQFFVCMDASRVKGGLPTDDSFMDLSTLIAEGTALLHRGDRRMVDTHIDPEAMRIILFTSGTTAASKGVMLNHKNICTNVHSIGQTLDLRQGERSFSILPLHHTFENTCDFFMINQGVVICFSDGLRYLLKNIKEWHVEIIIAVPLLFENIHKKIIAGIQETGKTRMIEIAVSITRFLRRFHVDIRRNVFKDILDKLGGHLRLVVIGGAAIDKSIIEDFNHFGVDFLMGYGLTETSPVISTSTVQNNVYGSVGPPMAGITVAIDTESDKRGAVGEILTQSDCVMMGYYENPEATAEVLTEDGWFHTGDMGYLDKKDCIHLTGRVKSMIVLTNGKKAFPEEIEALINMIPGVKESFVWGDESEKEVDICAKILIDRKEIGQHLAVPEKTPGDLSIAAYLKEKTKEINRRMPSYKSVHYFVFTETDMIKTTTLKIRRAQETAAIRESLEKANTTMKGAHGQCIDTLI